MRYVKSIFAAVLIAVCVYGFAMAKGDAPAPAMNVAPVIRELKSPLFAQPAFAMPGQDIPVSVELLTQGKVTAAILSPFDKPETQERFPIPAAKESEGVKAFSFKIPKSFKPGLYDLCVEIDYSGLTSKDCQKHAVSIVKSFNPPFKIVQLTDYHMGDPRAEKQFSGVDIKKVRVTALEAANRENPVFVLFTGDITAYPQTYERDYPAAYEELVSTLRVPAVIIPGNHDFYTWLDNKGNVTMDGVNYWKSFFGDMHRVLDYGPFRFVLFNSYDWVPFVRNQNMEYSLKSGKAHTYSGTLSESEFKWVEAALKGAGKRIPVLVAHHGIREMETNPVQWCKNCARTDQTLRIIKKYGVKYYFYGHIHKSMEFELDGTKYFATISTGSDVNPGNFWGMRIIDADKNNKITTKVVQLFDAPPMK